MREINEGVEGMGEKRVNKVSVTQVFERERECVHNRGRDREIVKDTARRRAGVSRS